MPDYATGPPAHRIARKPVIEAYVDTEALDHVCPKPKGGCGAQLGEFCHHPNGTERIIPCPVRVPPRPNPEIDGDGQ